MRRKMTLEEVHQYEIDLLRVVVKVCEQHDLRYYLAGGTLLGAIRHHGFIPWDDDIDILMPRPDYEKFLTYRKEIEACPYYKVAAHELKNVYTPFCKIFDTRTHIEKKYVDDEKEQNLWIDIQPLDGLPDSDREVRRMFRKSLRARRLLKLKKAKKGTGKTKLKRAVKPILLKLLNGISLDSIVSYIDKVARTYSVEGSNYIGCIVVGYGAQEKMPKDEYLPITKVEFEGMKLNAPACWDYYLTSLYGNYMQLPPKEKQQAHLMTIWVDDKI